MIGLNRDLFYLERLMALKQRQGNEQHWTMELTQEQLNERMKAFFGRRGKTATISWIVSEHLKAVEKLELSDLFLTDERLRDMRRWATTNGLIESALPCPQPRTRRSELLLYTTRVQYSTSAIATTLPV
jgi:hypothetical protein